MDSGSDWVSMVTYFRKRSTTVWVRTGSFVMCSYDSILDNSKCCYCLDLHLAKILKLPPPSKKTSLNSHISLLFFDQNWIVKSYFIYASRDGVGMHQFAGIRGDELEGRFGGEGAVEPKALLLGMEDGGHSIVNRGEEGIWGLSEQAEGVDGVSLWILPFFPDTSYREEFAIFEANSIRTFLGALGLPFVKAVKWDKAAALTDSLPESGFF